MDIRSAANRLNGPQPIACERSMIVRYFTLTPPFLLRRRILDRRNLLYNLLSIFIILSPSQAAF